MNNSDVYETATPMKEYEYNKNMFLYNNINIDDQISLCINSPSREKNKLVIVDDHKLIRQTTTNLINDILVDLKKEEDFSLLEATDGIDLLNLIKNDTNHLIKCIFVDENMEYLNGSEAVKIIRKLEAQKKIPTYNIICITAFDCDLTNKKILDAGFNQVIQKPCSKSITTEIISQIKK